MTTQDQALRIDVPVKLDEVRDVFSIASLSFEGDLPAALFHVGLILNDVAEWQASSRLIVIFHTNAGHMSLHDDAGFYPVSTDGLIKAENSRSRRATLRRMRGLWNRSR